MMNERKSPLRLRAIAPAVLLSLFLGAPSPAPGQALEGRWLLDFDREDGRVQLTMRRSSSQGNWNNSSSYALTDFRGLVRPAGTVQKPAHFEMVRDAGTIRFDGELDESGGSGRFQFAANPEFDKYWRSLGYSSLGPDDSWAFTMHDVGRKFLEDLRALGYERLPAERLISMRIHGASPEFIRELKALGYEHLPVEGLVNMRIHGANPEFVREMKELGYDRLPVDDLVSMRIHGVSPEFVRKLQELGYRRVPVEDLVSMRIHGVTIDYVKRMKERYDGVTVDELVNMRIHGRY